MGQPTPHETVAVTERKLEYSYLDYHCSHDPDELLDDVPARVLAVIDAYRGDTALDAYDPYDWGQLATHLNRHAATVGDREDDPEGDRDKFADELTATATQIEDAMHGGDCDCATWAFTSFTDCVDEWLNEVIPDGALVAVYETDEDEDPKHVGGEVSYETLRDIFAPSSYDGARIVYDPATGRGQVWFSDRGWGSAHEIYVLTDSTTIDRVELFAAGDVAPVRELFGVNLTPELTAALVALRNSAVTTKYTSWLGEEDCELECLSALDVARASKAAGVFNLPAEDLAMVQQAASTWTSDLRYLVGALEATA